ncbi:hypothetical protein CI41S_41600 [Bradyrhizobium ivorense]|nr:hypothetical protein CI41S_41600 [Bradyrhizobium ivorense]
MLHRHAGRCQSHALEVETLSKQNPASKARRNCDVRCGFQDNLRSTAGPDHCIKKSQRDLAGL